MLLVPQNMNCVHLKCFKIFSPYSILLYKSDMVTDHSTLVIYYDVMEQNSIGLFDSRTHVFYSAVFSLRSIIQI